MCSHHKSHLRIEPWATTHLSPSLVPEPLSAGLLDPYFPAILKHHLAPWGWAAGHSSLDSGSTPLAPRPLPAFFPTQNQLHCQATQAGPQGPHAEGPCSGFNVPLSPSWQSPFLNKGPAFSLCPESCTLNSRSQFPISRLANEKFTGKCPACARLSYPCSLDSWPMKPALAVRKTIRQN